MKKIFLIIIISSLLTNAQTLSNKWILVSESNNEKVYVDTSSIKKFENQISALIFSFYKTPKTIQSVEEKVYSSKEQIFFTMASQKYAKIGSLYYDDKLKILGEKSFPGLNINTQNFSEPIDSNETVKTIYDFCIKFLNKKEQISFEDQEKRKKEQKREMLIKIAEGKTSDLKRIDEQKSNLPKIESDSTIKVIDNRTLKEKFISSNQKLSQDNNWKPTTSKTIFSDGSKYVFQVSSWKNKAKAESEVRKLKSKGFDAFIVEANVPERGGKWYRVRVGYFNSIEEAEAAQKKLN
ncbi:SPOR domain-containing protein [Stygiobacter electus]|uniref:SPOR domain-containing protein n=1 Tax=Stygiobacter electus TaxID=3032292 RepID=A0AAE3TD90_9BACT|nr:SPOR domain-containing protein [Stygiobacter electus]MDF1613213.1 SPOR domain-containing protein [Stygiobacter electus]